MKRTVLATEITKATADVDSGKILWDNLSPLAKRVCVARQEGVQKYVARRGVKPTDIDAFVTSCIHHGITNALKAVH